MGGPANPFAFPGQPYGSDGLPMDDAKAGMSLRDWFAGQALVGLLNGQFSHSGVHNFDALPKEAFDVADAMLAARGEAA